MSRNNGRARRDALLPVVTDERCEDCCNPPGVAHELSCSAVPADVALAFISGDTAVRYGDGTEAA